MAFAFTFSPSLTLASCFVLCYRCWVGAKAFPPSGLTNSLPTNVSKRSGGEILPHPGKTGVSKRSSEEIKAIRLLCWELPPPNSNTLFTPHYLSSNHSIPLPNPRTGVSCQKGAQKSAPRWLRKVVKVIMRKFYVLARASALSCRRGSSLLIKTSHYRANKRVGAGREEVRS